MSLGLKYHNFCEVLEDRRGYSVLDDSIEDEFDGGGEVLCFGVFNRKLIHK